MQEEYILGLDISTKTIGIALFKQNGDKGDLVLLTHVTPKIKPEPNNKTEELFKKADAFFDSFLSSYVGFNITKVIIEEPLLQSNNVYTISTLLRFNGIIAKSVYDTFGVIPDFITSYDARKYAFPQLMGVRTIKKDGTEKTESETKKSKPTLFGAYDPKVDKKQVIWELVAETSPQIIWLYDKNMKLKKENFDMSDAYCAVLGYMKKNDLWK